MTKIYSQTPPDEDICHSILKRYRKAVEKRQNQEAKWHECRHYVLPEHDKGTHTASRSQIFDSTASDAVEQLSASLLAELTPAWTSWFDLQCGPDDKNSSSVPSLEDAAMRVQRYFERSNFLVEIHQCYLELVTVGTACLLFEEMPAGHPCPFHFTCVNIEELAFEENEHASIDTIFRKRVLEAERFKDIFPHILEAGQKDKKITIIEAILPRADGRYDYHIIQENAGKDRPVKLKSCLYRQNPFLIFRWTKTPGALYGISPIMKALPDIKTVNKVVELILKNAAIAVTGIWQADDDGVINPANIQLRPGMIIPKAVGSSGLTPLKSPGNFDVSQIILQDLRGRIRHALLSDKLGQANSPSMSATEVLERSIEMGRILGAIYGRLQVELLGPLIRRGLAILNRRGEIDNIHPDGRKVCIRYLSPLSRFHKDQEAVSLLQRLDWLRRLFPNAPIFQQSEDIIAKLAQKLDLPAELFLSVDETAKEPHVLEKVKHEERI